MSGPARNHQLLKRRIDTFLWDDVSMPVRRLRWLLEDEFTSRGRVAIIGGLVRDIARRGADGFRSDVDLVIEAPRQTVKDLALSLDASPNRFGGYGYQHPHWKVDFWALEDTWAVVHGHVEAERLDDLVHSTFFDCDAVLYDIEDRQVMASESYFERLAKNQIEINLRPNPSEDGNLLRAIRRIFCWGAEPGPLLHRFIFETLDEERFEQLHKVEQKLYPIAVTTYFKSAAALKLGLMDPSKRIDLETSVAEQMQLPGM